MSSSSNPFAAFALPTNVPSTVVATSTFASAIPVAGVCNRNTKRMRTAAATDLENMQGEDLNRKAKGLMEKYR